MFPCQTAAEVRASLPPLTDAVAFQCRNPIHRAHFELFSRALDAYNVRPGAVCLVRSATNLNSSIRFEFIAACSGLCHSAD